MSLKRTIIVGGGLVFIVSLISMITFYFSLGPCPEGSFPCDNGTVCVPQKAICNGLRNCVDGSDEDPIQCGYFVGSIEYMNRHMKRLLDLKNSGKKPAVSACSLDRVPECTCSFSTMLYCGYNNFTEVPQLPNQVTNLFLTGNKIQLKDSSFMNLYNLTSLNLRKNHISLLSAGIFQQLNNLEELNLDDNEIVYIETDAFKDLDNLKWLFLSSNHLTGLPLIELHYLKTLEWLDLSRNHLKLSDDRFPRLEKLYELQLEFNEIEEVTKSMFANLPQLHLLCMDHNRIRSIHPLAFEMLIDLRELRLSNNKFHYLPPDLFYHNTMLNTLHLANNFIKINDELLDGTNLTYINLSGINENKIDFGALRELPHLRYVIFKKFYYCHNVPNVWNCKPDSDGISSLNDLLTKPILRYSAWVMITFTCMGNSLVLWGRFAYRDENRAVSMVIRNLAVSDILMGFYLSIIGIQDYRYRNIYSRVASDWMASWLCSITGIVAMISSEVSMLILAFMSIERFLLIADPFGGHRRLNTRNVMTCLIIIWVMGTTMAIVPVILWQSSTRYYGIYSSTCFPLHIHDPYAVGWQYSAFVLLGINMPLLALIAVLYTGLLVSIWRTRRATPLSVLDCEFVIRFFFIVLTDVTCWAPIITLKILAFFNYQIPDDIYAWLMVFILPLNSAVNPVLYTFTTPKYRTQVLVRGWHKFTSRRKTDGSGTSNQGTDESQGKILPLLSNGSGNGIMTKWIKA